MAGLMPFNNRNKGIGKDGYGNIFNMIDDLFNDSWFSGRNSTMETFKVDVKERENAYMVEAEMPGVNREDIDLSLDDGKLFISVSHKEVNDDHNDDAFIHKERHFSSMQRSLYLADAKSEGVRAKLDDGLLKVMVPKEERQSAPSSRIEIE